MGISPNSLITNGNKMTNVVRTPDTYLMQAGDKGIFVSNIPMDNEYSIVSGIDYPGIITRVVQNSEVVIAIVNDAGEDVTKTVNYISHVGGYTTIFACIERDTYEKRVLDHYKARIKEAVDKHRVQVNQIVEQANSRLKNIGGWITLKEE